MRRARFVRKAPPSTDTKSWPTRAAARRARPSGRFSLSMMLNGAGDVSVGGCTRPSPSSPRELTPLLD